MPWKRSVDRKLTSWWRKNHGWQSNFYLFFLWISSRKDASTKLSCPTNSAMACLSSAIGCELLVESYELAYEKEFLKEKTRNKNHIAAIFYPISPLFLHAYSLFSFQSRGKGKEREIRLGSDWILISGFFFLQISNSFSFSPFFFTGTNHHQTPHG